MSGKSIGENGILLLLSKSICSYANYFAFTRGKQGAVCIKARSPSAKLAVRGYVGN